MSKINVLGTEYNIKLIKEKDKEMIKEECDGYCDQFNKEIVVLEDESIKYTTHVIKHELIHAFLCECGMQFGYGFHNEESVDFLASQAEKINVLFNKIGDVV